MNATTDRPSLSATMAEFFVYLIATLLVLVIATPFAIWMEASGGVAAAARTPPTSPPASFHHPVVTTPPLTAVPASATPPAPVTATAGAAPTTAVPAPVTNSGCAAALSYLSANAAPGFQFVCPGDADGAQALTCIGHAPCGPDQRMIVIADPCPAAYMNEAHNSWVLLNSSLGTPIPGGNTAIDPYGHC